MGESKVVELLRPNVEQEKAALEKLQTIGKRLAPEGARQQARFPGDLSNESHLRMDRPCDGRDPVRMTTKASFVFASQS